MWAGKSFASRVGSLILWRKSGRVTADPNQNDALTSPVPFTDVDSVVAVMNGAGDPLEFGASSKGPTIYNVSATGASYYNGDENTATGYWMAGILMRGFFKQAVDQIAHVVAAGAVVSIANRGGADIGPWVGLFIGASLGLVREIAEEGVVSPAALGWVVRSKNSMLDIAFWALGGLITGCIFHA